MTLGQGQEITLTFNTHITSFNQLVVCICQLSGHRLQQFLKSEKSTVFIFPLEKPSLPNLTLPQNRSGQPRVTIYTNFVALESMMLHAKFQDHRTSGSGEDF